MPNQTTIRTRRDKYYSRDKTGTLTTCRKNPMSQGEDIDVNVLDCSGDAIVHAEVSFNHLGKTSDGLPIGTALVTEVTKAGPFDDATMEDALGTLMAALPDILHHELDDGGERIAVTVSMPTDDGGFWNLLYRAASGASYRLIPDSGGDIMIYMPDVEAIASANLPNGQ